MLLHASIRETRSRVAVLVEDGFIEIKTIGGQAMPADALPDLLGSLREASEEFSCLCKKADEYNLNKRVHPWRLITDVGMSGRRDVYLQVLQDIRLQDVKTVARLHISMYNKLNESIRMPLIDFRLILDESDEIDIGDYTIEAWEMSPINLGEWNLPEEDVQVDEIH